VVEVKFNALLKYKQAYNEFIITILFNKINKIKVFLIIKQRTTKTVGCISYGWQPAIVCKKGKRKTGLQTK